MSTVIEAMPPKTSDELSLIETAECRGDTMGRCATPVAPGRAAGDRIHARVAYGIGSGCTAWRWRAASSGPVAST